MIRLRVIAVVAALGMGIAGPHVRAEQNIVKNGSMEFGPGPLSEDPLIPADWIEFGNVSERSAEANLAPAGAGHALKAFCSTPQEGAYQEVPAVPGNQARISCSMYTRASDKLGGDAQAGIALEFYNASNNVVGGTQVNFAMTAASPADTWVPVSVGPFTAPAGTVKVRMTCVWVCGTASGSVYWDGCSLTINNGANLLLNPNFEVAGVGENSPTGIDFWTGFNDQGKSQDFAFDGGSSLRVGMGDPFSGLVQNMDSLSEGDRILLLARVYQSSANPLVAGDRAGIKLEFFPPGGGNLPPPTENLAIGQPSTQDQWIPVQLTLTGITVPDGASLARINMIFFAGSSTTGSVFFDSSFAGTPAGANRLLNASFEAGALGGIQNWTLFGATGATAGKSSEVEAHNGDFTMKANFTAEATFPAATGIWQEVPVTEGETINISAFLQVASFEPVVGAGVAGVKVEWIAGSIPGNVDITTGPSANTITAASPKNQWIDLTIDYTMPPGAEAGVRFVALVARSGGTVGAAYFDACEAVVYTHFDGADVDNDDDEDLRDFADFQRTFSGNAVLAVQWNATVFDHDEDGDVDLTDYAYFRPRITGP